MQKENSEGQRRKGWWSRRGRKTRIACRVIGIGIAGYISLAIIVTIIQAATASDEADEQVAAAPTAVAPPPEATAVQAPEPTDTPAPTAVPVTYEIAERKDISFMGAVRIVYKVRVSRPLTEDDLRRIAQEIIDDETSRQDVNAISFFFYLPGTDITGAYSAGRAVWALDGNWGEPYAEAGDYSRHELGLIDVGGVYREVGQLEETTGLSEEQRRAIFKELVAAEDRTNAEAEAIYPLDIFDPNYQEGNLEKNLALWDELLDKYQAEVRAKYGITEEQQGAIILEGITEYWHTE